MNQILVYLSQIIGADTPLNSIDLLLTLSIVLFAVLTIYNILSSKDKKIDIKDEKVDATKQIVESEEKPSIEEIIVKDDTKSSVEEAVVKPDNKPTVTWNKRLFSGLARTRSEVWDKVSSLVSGSKLDDSKIEELEEVLFSSDLSPVLVDELIEELKKMNHDEDSNHIGNIKEFLKSKMQEPQSKVNTELYDLKKSSDGPKVIMIVGVNGAGKTTTIGKFATKLKAQGASVVVGACDTFRAAAVEQLEVWCNRAGVEIVKSPEGADPSGVAYDAVAKAKEINADYCIIDTAGRLHTKSNLMDELAKTKKVMSKVIPGAPHETLLVVDAITGQNALRQAEEFNKSLDLTGLIFTKCDGSSKAGSAVSIVQSLNVPIVYIGVGEDVEDLNIFDLDDFLNALLGIQS